MRISPNGFSRQLVPLEKMCLATEIESVFPHIFFFIWKINFKLRIIKDYHQFVSINQFKKGSYSKESFRNFPRIYEFHICTPSQEKIIRYGNILLGRTSFVVKMS